MEDYKELIKEMLSSAYAPNHVQGYDSIYLSTYNVYAMCMGIIPEHPITEHDVYDVMKEMGFEIKHVCEKNQKTKKENPVFLWKLYKKK